MARTPRATPSCVVAPRRAVPPVVSRVRAVVLSRPCHPRAVSRVCTVVSPRPSSSPKKDLTDGRTDGGRRSDDAVDDGGGSGFAQVLVLTDGQPSDGNVSDLQTKLQARAKKVFLSFLMCTSEDEVVQLVRTTIGPTDGVRGEGGARQRSGARGGGARQRSGARAATRPPRSLSSPCVVVSSSAVGWLAAPPAAPRSRVCGTRGRVAPRTRRRRRGRARVTDRAGGCRAAACCDCVRVRRRGGDSGDDDDENGNSR